MTEIDKDKKKAQAEGTVEEKRLKPRLIRRRVTPAAKATEETVEQKAQAAKAAEAAETAPGKEGAVVEGEPQAPVAASPRKKGAKAKAGETAPEAPLSIEAKAEVKAEVKLDVSAPVLPPVIEVAKGKLMEPELKGKKPKLKAKKEKPVEIDIAEALAEEEEIEAAPEVAEAVEAPEVPLATPAAQIKQVKVFGKEPHGGRKTFPAAPTFRTGKKRKGRQEQQRQQKASGLHASRPLMKTEITVPKAAKRVIRIVEAISVAELSQRLGVKAGEIIKKLMGLGIMATVNQMIDFDSATLVAADFGYEVESAGVEEIELMEGVPEEGVETASLLPRPPVVTVMGHVDHGKTSLLDAIRQTNVVSGEAGGITQHIGAYHVHLEKGDITFLDTPGHEAFTSMRARGAKVTDIVVLVVAADDGVKPQTVEAINHAKAAQVPIIVAINKIDLPGADPARVRQELSHHALLSEEWGGDTLFMEVSAKKRLKIKELLELILLQSEMLELRAPVEALGKGIVIEAKLDKGRGPVATVLVQTGTIRAGDAFVSGVNSGRIRAMMSDWGMRIESAGPSMPIEVLGLSVVPSAGDDFLIVRDEATAKQVASIRLRKTIDKAERKTAKVSLADLYERISKGEVKELKLVIKADVQGSIEAVKEALLKLSTPAVTLVPIHTGVGGISEGDCMLAAASNAIVIGFNVRPEPKAQQLAESENVDIRLYNIIYNLIDDVKKAMEGLLAPIVKEKTLGRAEVRNVIRITKVGNVAGSYVLDGLIRRNALARLLRESVVVYQGKISSLKRFKDDAREVQAGYECGISLENYNDVKAGDVIEAYILEEEAAKL